jgi:hypothetical protein
MPETRSSEPQKQAELLMRRYRLPGLGLGRVGPDGAMLIVVSGLRVR